MTHSQPTPIYHQLNTLASIDSSYDKRRAIDELDPSVNYSVSVTIDKIAKNYSYVREDGYRDAYYITGAAAESEHRVKVLLPTAMNSEVESWNEGETILLEASISDWDLAYKQFGLLGRSSIVADKDVDKAVDEVVEPISDSAMGAAEPADETDSPADETDSPADETDSPADETDSPVDESDSPADETDSPITNTDNVQDETERDTQSDALTEQEGAIEPEEEPIIVEEVATDNEDPESIESAEINQAQEEVIDLESEGAQAKEPEDGIPANQELGNFIDQMEAPTPLEQLAEEYADAPPSDSKEEISLQTAIPVIGDVPILKDVPTRGAASAAPQTKRFSNHTPVRPTRLSSKVKEDESRDQTKKIINITVGVCVGIMVLMCLCCGIFSQASG
jgi:hypothetical protein